MKKLLFFLALFTGLALFYSPPATAQIVKKTTVVKDSTVDADVTTIVLPVDNITRSAEIHCTKVNGTIAGKAVLEGLAHDGTNWIGIDSLTLGNYPINFKLFSLPSGLPHAVYRFKVTETGSGKMKPIVAYTLRRS